MFSFRLKHNSKLSAMILAVFSAMILTVWELTTERNCGVFFRNQPSPLTFFLIWSPGPQDLLFLTNVLHCHFPKHTFHLQFFRVIFKLQSMAEKSFCFWLILITKACRTQREANRGHPTISEEVIYASKLKKKKKYESERGELKIWFKAQHSEN